MSFSQLAQTLYVSAFDVLIGRILWRQQSDHTRRTNERNGKGGNCLLVLHSELKLIIGATHVPLFLHRIHSLDGLFGILSNGRERER